MATRNFWERVAESWNVSFTHLSANVKSWAIPFRPLFGFAFLFAVTVSLAGADEPMAFTVEGIVRLETVSESSQSTLPKVFEVPFKVGVQGCKWRIDLLECVKHPDSTSTYQFDGLWLHVLHSFPKVVEKELRAGNRVPGNVAAARIQQVPFPRELITPEASFLWLTYCSSCRFCEATTGEFVPVFAYGGVEVYDGKTLVEPREAYWTLAETSPFVPRSFVGMGRIPERMLKALSAAQGKSAGELSGSFTNVLFLVDSITNLGAVTLVSSAHATLLGPKIPPSDSVGVPALSMRLVATSISLGVTKDPSVAPTLPGPTTVADDRSQFGSLSFVNRTNWVSEQETTNSPQFARLRARGLAAPISDPPSAPKYVVRGVLAVSIVALGAALFFLNRKSNKPSVNFDKLKEQRK